VVFLISCYLEERWVPTVTFSYDHLMTTEEEEDGNGTVAVVVVVVIPVVLLP